MGIFSRKQPEKSDGEKIADMLEEIKVMMDNNKEISGVLLVRTPKFGTSLIQGEYEHIFKLMKTTAIQDIEYAKIILSVANEIRGIVANKVLPHGINPDAIKKEMGNDKAKVIKLPDGTTALAVNHNDISSISDADVDKILDEILRRQDDEEPEE